MPYYLQATLCTLIFMSSTFVFAQTNANFESETISDPVLFMKTNFTAEIFMKWNPYHLSNGTYNVTLSYKVKNYGNVNLSSVQLSQNLLRSIGAPSSFNVVGPVLSTGTLLLNPSFDAKTDTNMLLSANSILGYKQESTLSYTINITPFTAPSGWVGGFVYNDLNRNGVKDANESALAGRNLFIDLDNDGRLDANEPSAVTDETGLYIFKGLEAGTYQVRLIEPHGWSQTSPRDNSALSVTIKTGEHSRDNDFFVHHGKSRHSRRRHGQD